VSLPAAAKRRRPNGSNLELTGPPVQRRVELVPVASLQPHPGNTRTHSRQQIRQLARSIEEFGWTYEILIDRDCRVICGHARLEAARFLKL
jgi:ParB-like chromosome segregation protein Spo0J